jgi:hypothetical protein
MFGDLKGVKEAIRNGANVFHSRTIYTEATYSSLPEWKTYSMLDLAKQHSFDNQEVITYLENVIRLEKLKLLDKNSL